ncbi:MAG: hypothetical protein WC112_08570 [Proteiniphilum sp.]
MDYYYLIQNSDRTPDIAPEEVHRQECRCLKNATHSIYLGCFSSSHDAVEHARRIYPFRAELCPECCVPALTESMGA